MPSDDLLIGFCAPIVLYALILALHLLLPARHVDGYVQDPQTGRPLKYRLNGLLVFLVVVVLWLVSGWQDWFAWDWLYLHRWSALAGACTLGLVYTLIVVLPAPTTGKPLLVDLFLGRIENRNSTSSVLIFFMEEEATSFLKIDSLTVERSLGFGEREIALRNPARMLHYRGFWARVIASPFLFDLSACNEGYQ